LLGNQGNETISIESAAKLIGTIPYEVVCNVGTKTLKKMYKHCGETNKDQTTLD
jgi:alanine racemase